MLFGKCHSVHLLLQFDSTALFRYRERIPFRPPFQIRFKVIGDVFDAVRILEGQFKEKPRVDLLSPNFSLLQHPCDKALVQGNWSRAKDGLYINLIKRIMAQRASVTAADLGLAPVAPSAASTGDARSL